jgi:hypothetical protein
MLRLLAQFYGKNPVRVEWADSLVQDLSKHGVKISLSTARAYVYGMRKPSKVVLEALEKVKTDRLGNSDPEIPQHIQIEVEALNTRRLIKTITLDKRHKAMDERYRQIAEAAREAGAKMSVYADCVQAMCAMCVGPGGACMITDCPLRSVSPIPLGYGAKTMAETEKENRNV